jgi:hypothetical protein
MASLAATHWSTVHRLGTVQGHYYGTSSAQSKLWRQIAGPAPIVLGTLQSLESLSTDLPMRLQAAPWVAPPVRHISKHFVFTPSTNTTYTQSEHALITQIITDKT